MKHWAYYTYDKKIPVKGQEENFRKGVFQMINMVEINVLAENEKQANLKVKQFLKRKFYQLAKGWEEHDSSISEDMQMIQLEMQKKILDLLKGH